MYDFALGGKDNFEVDRLAVEKVAELVPGFREVGHANRGFLIRATETIADLGVDQFLDIGTGIPTPPSMHEVAQIRNPLARVVYVDNDPIVMAHNRALRGSRPGVLTLARDLRQPASVVDNSAVRAHLDFNRPIGLLMVAVLHFIRRDLAAEVVAQYLKSLPSGSYLGISTACSDGMDGALIERLEAVYSRAAAPIVLRSRSQIEQLFEGVDLLEPGIVDVTEWRDDETAALPIRILSGVGKVR
jgi:predicted ribosome-associated RNA-binding protein Tma20